MEQNNAYKGSLVDLSKNNLNKSYKLYWKINQFENIKDSNGIIIEFLEKSVLNPSS